MPKGRESDMPDETSWESFFDARCALPRFGCSALTQHVVEFGCGYGTFTIPAAKIVSGTVFAFDIDPEMIAATRQRANCEGLCNVVAEVRDFMSHGTGIASQTADFVMLFNILHIEHPLELLMEAKRILRTGGCVGIMHWRSDIDTPRGPSLSIRPTFELCRQWGEQAGLTFDRQIPLDCCPWHWGFAMKRHE